MRILHFVLILAVSILLKNVYCDSSNPLPNAPLSSLPKTKASPNFLVLGGARKNFVGGPKQFFSGKTLDGRDEMDLFFLTHEISRTLSGPHVARPPPPPPPPPPPSSKVRSYTLALQWPPGVCSGKNNTCRIPKVPTEFTIHGLWPQYSPEDPPTPKTFDISLLGVLTTELEKSWPNLWSAQQQVVYNLLFWNMEWNKHGRFSEMEGLDYFNKALELFKDVGQGLKGKLVAEGITPVNAEINKKTYTLVDIKTALQKINGVSCAVRCVTSKLDNVEQINEIRFSYKQNFDKQDTSAISNCTGPNVRFPA